MIGPAVSPGLILIPLSPAKGLAERRDLSSEALTDNLTICPLLIDIDDSKKSAGTDIPPLASSN